MTLEFLTYFAVKMEKKMLRALSVAFYIVILAGCTDSGARGGGDEGSLGDLDLQIESFEVDSNSAGVASFNLSVKPGVSSFQIVAHSATGLLSLSSVTEPSGNTIVEPTSSKLLTGALTPQVSPLTFAAPLLGVPLSAGDYTITLRTNASNGAILGNQRITIDFVTRAGGGGSSGVLRVNMILVGPVGDSEPLRDGLESAVGIWKQIYARANLELDVKWYSVSGPAQVPDPRSANAYYADLISGRRSGALNVVVASDVAADSRSEDLFGIAGATPGPATSTAKSVVALSILSVTGRDGRFDFGGIGATVQHNDEVRLAAEEFSQLAAHYLGLTHIVELNSGNTVTSSDLLSDTNSCVTVTDCREERDVAENIMFPAPLRKNRDSDEFNQPREYFPRDRITRQQQAVLHSNILID